MLLALDIGNTQTSVGIFQKSKLKHHWRLETNRSRTPDEYAAFLFPLLSHLGFSNVKWDGVAICSVVPPVETAFLQFSKTYLKMETFRVNSECKLGFKLNVDIPKEVGADRLANTAYAVKHMTLPAIVIDLGTATTFDVITADKSYQGGIILPGVSMGVESLSKRTSLLPIIDVAFPPSVIGKDTVTCIQSGMLFGYCDMLDGLMSRLILEIGSPCDIALTGGLAGLFYHKLKTKTHYLPNLTLEGIEILFREN